MPPRIAAFISKVLVYIISVVAGINYVIDLLRQPVERFASVGIRENKVFVAISFDPMLDKRWENVIDPAVRKVERNNLSLEPHRVDIRRVSDSILTEILSSISRSLVIFA